MASKPIWKIAVGDEAPDFTLPGTGDSAGKGARHGPFTLSRLRGKKNAVLVFYPAAFTPV